MLRSMKLSAVALCLVLAACGGNGGGADTSEPDSAFGRALAASFLDDEDTPVSEAEANCVANGIIDAVGEDELIEAGLDEAFLESGDDIGDDIQLTQSQAEGAADAFIECVDVAELFLDSMGRDEEIPDSVAECMIDALDDDTIRSFLVAGFTGGDDEAIVGQLMGPIFSCLGELDPDQLGEMMEE